MKHEMKGRNIFGQPKPAPGQKTVEMVRQDTLYRDIMGSSVTCVMYPPSELGPEWKLDTQYYSSAQDMGW